MDNLGILVDLIRRNKGKVVKVGFTKGSNYIFCGEVTDETLDILKKIEDIKVNEMKMNLDKTRAHIEYLEEIGEDGWIDKSIEDFKARKAKDGMTEKEIEKILPTRKVLKDRYWQSVKTMKNRIKHYNETLEQDHPVMEAPVATVYKSTVNKDEVSIILNGYFCGAFWDVEEFEAMKNQIYGF